MHPLVKELLGDKTSREIKRACGHGKVSRMAVDAWLKEDAAPRVNNLVAVGETFGYELVWRRKELLPMRPMTQPRATTSKLRLIYQNKRMELWDQTHMVAYVDDDDKLTAIGKDGYAVSICGINHRSEIVPKFEEWKAKQDKP